MALLNFTVRLEMVTDEAQQQEIAASPRHPFPCGGTRGRGEGGEERRRYGREQRVGDASHSALATSF